MDEEAEAYLKQQTGRQRRGRPGCFDGGRARCHRGRKIRRKRKSVNKKAGENGKAIKMIGLMQERGSDNQINGR